MSTNKQLNILLIAKTLPWQFKGGIQTHTWELAKSLIELGHNVSILNGGPYKEKVFTFDKEGIEITQIPYFPGRYLKPISLIAEEFSFNWAALRWIKKHHSKFNIIHAQGRSGYLLGYFKAVRNRLVNTVHGLIDIENQDKKWYQFNHSLHHIFTKKIEDKLYKNSIRLVAVSHSLKEELAVKRAFRNSVTVISNGVKSMEIQETRLKCDKAKFLFVGRLHPVKGISRIVEQMNNADYNVQLDIIGDGGEREKIERIIAKNGLSKKVRLLGERNNEEIHRLLPYYSALVLPSFYETQGIVLLEANAEGVAVIASDLPSIQESITHGENGILCSKDDPMAFILAMNHLAQNPSEAEKMGAIGKIRVQEQFSWKSVAQKTESLYYSLSA